MLPKRKKAAQQPVIPVKKRTWERYDPKKYGSNKTPSAGKHAAKKRKVTQRAIEKQHYEVWYHRFFDFHRGHDVQLFSVLALLILVGIIAVYSSSIIFAYRYTDNQYYYLTNHLLYVGVGIIFASFFYFLRVEFLTRIWYAPLAICIGLLIYILIMSWLGKADAVNGATRWIDVGSFSFQPSDFTKLAFVLFVAAFLSSRRVHYKDFKEYVAQHLFPYSCWFVLILLLILLGKNLGTTMVVGFIGLACYGVGAVTKYHKTGFMILLGFGILGGVLFSVYEGYRADRIAVWMNYLQTGDTAIEENGIMRRDKRSYQVDQHLTSLGTGGLTGVGLGQSTGKFYFPQTTAGDDGIFSIIGEEVGFYLTVLLLLAFMYLIIRSINISRMFVGRPLYFYIMIGCTTWIGYQMFVHIGVNLSILPLTGQTLPFISLGGSSLISLMGAAGLMLNVSKAHHFQEQENRAMQGLPVRMQGRLPRTKTDYLII